MKKEEGRRKKEEERRKKKEGRNGWGRSTTCHLVSTNPNKVVNAADDGGVL
ncbi:hypothetical protein [Okeania sp. KiyG1]|uniref:hypothetical protein n=1 Tax=Okeania sp. KiyG1 TaxID=2720165 RepID=UPI001924BB1A|nr:hypothetical protein [Okeania sp. KiyG1]